MNADWTEKIFRLLIFLPAFVSALTVHEFAHAYVADKLGDDTPRREGRVSLDPMVHLDPMGSLLIVLGVLFGLPIIGFARPVMTNPRNFKNPRRDSVLVAIAGPISNILQLFLWLASLFALRLIVERISPDFAENVFSALVRQPVMGDLTSIFGAVVATGILTNLGLAVFNMIPVPPLDGHWVLEGLGPPFITDLFNAIRPYSFILLYALLWTGAITAIMMPVYKFSMVLVLWALTGSWLPNIF